MQSQTLCQRWDGKCNKTIWKLEKLCVCKSHLVNYYEKETTIFYTEFFTRKVDWRSFFTKWVTKLANQLFKSQKFSVEHNHFHTDVVKCIIKVKVKKTLSH